MCSSIFGSTQPALLAKEKGLALAAVSLGNMTLSPSTNKEGLIATPTPSNALMTKR